MDFDRDLISPAHRPDFGLGSSAGNHLLLDILLMIILSDLCDISGDHLIQIPFHNLVTLAGTIPDCIAAFPPFATFVTFCSKCIPPAPTWRPFRNLATFVKRTDRPANDATQMVIMPSPDLATRVFWVRSLNSVTFACTRSYQNCPQLGSLFLQSRPICPKLRPNRSTTS